MFWLHMNKGLWFSSPKKIMLTILNVFAICVGVALVSDIAGILPTLERPLTNKIQCVLGLYASGSAIHDSTGSASFSCTANNA